MNLQKASQNKRKNIKTIENEITIKFIFHT